LRAAGAQQVLLASPHRVFWVREGDGHTEPRLAELLTMLDARTVDLVLVEGFRQEPVAKIEVHRPSLQTPLLCEQDSSIIALACDASPRAAVGIPLLPLNDPTAVAEFVLRWFAERTATDR
jgi:molybdopterin-guanine dinucleotide biosynthesis protein B